MIWRRRLTEEEFDQLSDGDRCVIFMKTYTGSRREDGIIKRTDNRNVVSVLDEVFEFNELLEVYV